VIAAGTVVATGAFDGEHASGVAEVVALDKGFFEARLTNFTTDVIGPYTFELSPFPLTPERTCLDMYAYELPDISQWHDGTTPLGDFRSLGSGDPSFLDGLAITQLVEADREAHDCLRTIIARAPLTWTIPDFRPDLHVVDSGTTGGATGEATVVAGKVVSYLVAPNDITEEIAARFGITTADIAWLNPFRGNEAAVDGETINLDRGNR